MPIKKNENKRTLIGIAVVLTGVAVLTWLILNQQPVFKPSVTKNQTRTPKQENTKPIEKGAVQGQIIVKPDIDYQYLKKDEALKQLMGDRKENLGIKKSLDMIVNSDESFKVGDNQVSMQDILEKSQIQTGGMFTQKIEQSGAVSPAKIKEYGIYVVQPNDNIWNIHFNILKEYYESRGINVSPRADEPIQKGLSSGVGKILKFSENMVVIYNMVDKKVASNIDLLEPLSKVVVYNMDEVFSLLSKIDYEQIDRLQFDGKTIWIPAKK
ncbi:MAG: hypothetical protein ABIJ31_10935 [Pseudomonadota bacterium]